MILNIKLPSDYISFLKNKYKECIPHVMLVVNNSGFIDCVGNIENITKKYVRCYIDDKYKELINVDNCTLMYHFTTGMGKGDKGYTPDNQSPHRICMIMLGPKDYKERFSKNER